MDYLAVGALTHSAPALDIGLDLVQAASERERDAADDDVGNTNTVLGVFDGEEVVEHWRIATDPVRTADELAVVLQGLIRQSTALRTRTSPGSRCAPRCLRCCTRCGRCAAAITAICPR